MTDVNQLITEHLDIWTSAIEKKSSAGRGNGGAFSLYGIKKLRELILELAVRGKLVPQDEEEGTAEKLLKELGRGKAELAAKGEIKTPRQIEHRKTPKRHPVPSGWLWVHIDQVGAVVGGGTPKASDPKSFKEPGDGFPWLTPADLSGNTELYVERGSRDLSESGLAKSSATRMPANTVLFTSRAPIGYVAISAGPIATNQGFKSVVPFHVEMSKYIALVLRCFAPEIDAAAPGTTFKEVSGKIVAGLSFPLPPLAEQHRIVAKADELMALCDALEGQAEDSLKAHQTLVETCLATLTNSQTPEALTHNWTRIEAQFDTLFTTEESVEALRRAVLDLALRGLLTEQISGETPASDLLRKLYDKNKKSASSRHRTIVSKTKKAEPPFDLPESWAWSNLGLLSSDLRYGTSKKCDRDDKLVPVLRIPNVSGGRVDLDDMKFGPLDPKEVEDLRLRSNDLLIIRSNGSLDIVGSFAVVPELEGDFAFAGYLVRVRIDPAFVDPRYIWYVSRSRFIRDQIEGPIRHGVGLKNVNSTELASLQFPIPPREEQERIVDKLDDLFEICDRLAQRVDDSNTINFTLADTLTSKIN
ncbi:restriction endonuclease subunit S [Albibacillus kandeliae]|uniref:restriction endonuclease subunit S n=1 Tax=Albibacillus kandeliae TaxID=2174228 RepID=UPI000D694C88|nr:restriction endonuclease subunit S [Albibacillus kandeliae]